jgi:peptidoglycan glycosyltransferase
VDSALQEFCYSQLEGKKGSVTIIEPSTGKILALASSPSFDSNTVSANWASLSQDTENSPLLNRATQGLYPPGSVFKIVTATAALEHVPEAQSITYLCEGEAAFPSKVIECYNSTVHGSVNFYRAFAVSCNTYFSSLGLKITAANLQSTAKRLMFNTTIPFDLQMGESRFALTKSSREEDVLDSSIGQGRTMATPVHMALLASAVANGGIMMSPYIIDHYMKYNGKQFDKRMPSMLAEVFSMDEAAILASMMKEAVDHGTGAAAAVNWIDIAAKTGSAENGTPEKRKEDHGWLVCFGPYENPKWAMCVMVENIGGSGSILPMCKSIVEYLRDNI